MNVVSLTGYLVALAALLIGLPQPLAAQSEPALVLEPCRIDAGSGVPTAKAQCGKFVVPENPADPNGRQISLDIALVPALNVEPQADPLVFFAGGPGQAAIDSYLSLRGAFEYIRRERPILLVDQRGTGGSNRLSCDLPDPEQAALEVDLALVREQTSQCINQLSGDPRYYTTSVAVDDIDAVRRALGFEQVNLWGGSYGTRVALHYLRKYPQATRSVIIDGVVPADMALGPSLSLDAQSSLVQLFSRCEQTPSCAETFGDLQDTFAKLLAQLRDVPVTVPTAHPRTGVQLQQRIGVNELAGVVRILSYNPLTRATLPLMIHEAHEGRYQMLAANAAMINEDFADLMAVGMHNAVVCSEDAPRFSDMPDMTAAREQTYMGDLQFQYLEEICATWPAGIRDDDFYEPVDTTTPVLLLSGEFDPVTPPANAERAAKTLSNSRHIVAPKQGHIISSLGCVPQLLGQFIETLDVDALEADCVNRLGPLPIFVSPSGPTP